VHVGPGPSYDIWFGGGQSRCIVVRCVLAPVWNRADLRLNARADCTTCRVSAALACLTSDAESLTGWSLFGDGSVPARVDACHSHY